MTSTLMPRQVNPGDRWMFLRDVLVFQLKLLVDQLHRETSGTRDRAREVVERAADRLRTTFDSESPKKDE